MDTCIYASLWCTHAGSSFYNTFGSSECAEGETNLYAGHVAMSSNGNNAYGGFVCVSSSARPIVSTPARRQATVDSGLTMVDVTDANGNQIPCAGCVTSDESVVITYPDSMICPAGFNMKYAGFLAANPKSPGNSICVHADIGVDLVLNPSDSLAVVSKVNAYSANAVTCVVCSL